LQPSTAHTRSANRRPAASICGVAGVVGAIPADREYPAALVDDLDGG
jgi:hypothetical protein